MLAWKRRLAVLVAVMASAGFLMSTADAREPRDRGTDFTIPSFTVPTSPPPTMPPLTTTITSPPPTMPPLTTTITSPPPTMPPTTISTDVSDQLRDFADLLEEINAELFETLIEFLQNPFGVD